MEHKLSTTTIDIHIQIPNQPKLMGCAKCAPQDTNQFPQNQAFSHRIKWDFAELISSHSTWKTDYLDILEIPKKEQLLLNAWSMMYLNTDVDRVNAFAAIETTSTSSTLSNPKSIGEQLYHDLRAYNIRPYLNYIAMQ